PSKPRSSAKRTRATFSSQGIRCWATSKPKRILAVYQARRSRVTSPGLKRSSSASTALRGMRLDLRQPLAIRVRLRGPIATRRGSQSLESRAVSLFECGFDVGIDLLDIHVVANVSLDHCRPDRIVMPKRRPVLACRGERPQGLAAIGYRCEMAGLVPGIDDALRTRMLEATSPFELERGWAEMEDVESD